MISGERRRELVDWVAREAAQPVPEVARFWGERLALAPGAAAALFYGSGLRAGDSGAGKAPEMVYDFYLLVRRFQDLGPGALPALGGRLAPPNVYYFEERWKGGWTRCKVAAMTLGQFCSEARDGAFTPHIWARFCQPSRVLFCSDEETRSALSEAMADSLLAFHRRTLGLVASATVGDFWRAGLASTYADEIRSERKSRPGAICEENADSLRERTRLSLGLLPEWGRLDEEGVVHSRLTPLRRRRFRAKLRLIRPLRKAVVALRLFKAAFTFQNGLEYARWKVERHSGLRFEISPFEKRHPLWGGLRLFFRAARQGALR